MQRVEADDMTSMQESEMQRMDNDGMTSQSASVMERMEDDMTVDSGVASRLEKQAAAQQHYQLSKELRGLGLA